jgi:lipopolysaccharide/colanic/teichoic acid biosynthesis glycosyltransferase
MRSSVDSSVVGKDYSLENGDICRKIAVKGHLTLGEANLMQPDLIDGYSVLDDSRISIKSKRFIYLTAKRALDIIISFFTLLLGLPVFLIISSAIKNDSRAPILFSQRRCTKGGRSFSMIKFRSMAEGSENLQTNLRHKNEADGPLFKMADDPRLTRVGRFLRSTSLDELPQFLNVLMGEMSLVGPRPLVMKEMGYSPEWRDARLRVKAGITGMWQVNGRSDTLFHDWIKNDIYYVRNQSLWLDLKILLKTIRVVATRLGAR